VANAACCRNYPSSLEVFAFLFFAPIFEVSIAEHRFFEMNFKFLLTGIGLLLVSGVAKGSGLLRLSNQLVVSNAVNHLFSAGRLILQVVPTIKNPTSESIGFFHPFVRIQLAGQTEPLASSQVQGTFYELQARSELKLDPIIISLSVVDLLSIGIQLGKDLAKDKKATIQVKTMIELTSQSLPLEKVDNYQIRLPF